MNDEMKSIQTGDETDAQKQAPEEQQLEKSEPDAGAPASPGEGSGAPAGDAGAEGAAAGEGTAAEEAHGPNDAEGAAAEAEAGGDTDSAAAEKTGHGDAEKELARGRLAEARLGSALLHGALQAAGIPKARLDYAARLIDAGGIDPLSDGAAAAYAERAQKLIADIPELIPAPPTGTTGSAGEHARKHETPEADTAARFRSGMGR